MKIIAKAIVYDKTNKVLTLRRSITHPTMPHHFDLPGGEVKVNEPNYLGMIREIYEETGLTVLKSSVKLIYNIIPRQNVTHILYTAKIKQQEPGATLSWEHDAYYWIAEDELCEQAFPENVDDYYQSAIEYLCAKRKDGGTAGSKTKNEAV